MRNDTHPGAADRSGGAPRAPIVNRRRALLIGLAGYIVLVHCVLVVAIIRPYRLVAAIDALTGNSGEDWRPTEFWSTMVAMQARVDASAAGSVLFLGDSGVQSMNVNAIAPNIVNYGIGGDTIEGVIQRLPVYRSLPQAKAVIISVGSNDLLRRDASAAAAWYGRLVARIDKRVPILANAVLPVDERSVRSKDGFRDNNEIIRLNRAIETICAARPNCYYVDPGPLLVDDTGNLRRAFHGGDGLHLSADGYRPWVQALRKSLINAGAIPPGNS